LEDGDHLHIPLMDREKGIVTVLGAVKSPGEYEFVDGDRLEDILQLAGGVLSYGDSSRVEVVRFQTDNWRFRLVSLDLGKEEDKNFLLQPDDRVMVRAVVQFRPQYQVTVTGEVRYPGVYPIIPDTTTLAEVIAMCGGFTPYADLRLATLYREVEESFSTEREFERLQWTLPEYMSASEYSYFKARLRQLKPIVEVDFRKVLSPTKSGEEVKLKANDYIVVPPVRSAVQVLGQVNRPGWLPYKPGENVHYYITLAGGYALNAQKSKVRIINPQTGVWSKPKRGYPIEMGDIIFVPEKKESDVWELTKDLLLVASQIATLLLALRTI
ncbi:MAG: SLBB domain-containing protein, partial [bacterium]